MVIPSAAKRSRCRLARRAVLALAICATAAIGATAATGAFAAQEPAAGSREGRDALARQRLARLEVRLRTELAEMRTPLYHRLRAARSGPQGALNANPDLQLELVDRVGMPRFQSTINLISAQTISTDRVWPGGGHGFALDGVGAFGELAIWDSGHVRSTHQEYAGRIVFGDLTGQIRFHPTLVAGTIVATGVRPEAHGMGAAANLVSYDWEEDELEMAAAAAAGLLVSNHSYVWVAGWLYNGAEQDWFWYGDVLVSEIEDAGFGFYHDGVRWWDEIAHAAPDYLIVKGAGNDRIDTPEAGVGHYYWNPEIEDWEWSTRTREPDGGDNGYDTMPYRSCAKNVLTIGAVHDIPGGWTSPADVVMTGFSSWGPTDDGRIKPDLVANGHGMLSCAAASDTSYSVQSGTSLSAPAVSGSAHLLAGLYRDTHGGQPAWSATLKAVLIHTVDEAGPASGPDYKFGWGLMNTLAAAEIIAADAADAARIIEATLSEGDTDTWYLAVSGDEPVVATLVWNDPPGEPPVWSLNPPDLMLVNDLELRLEEPQGGTVHAPWVLNPAAPGAVAMAGDNQRDNVEKVEVATPVAGTWRLSVTHDGTLADGAQDYALVVSGLTTPVAVDGTDEVPAVALQLEQNVPNPFNPLTTIAYELPTAGPVRLGIHALDGRRLRTLVDGTRAAGRHVAAWDGRDGAGRAVAAGVYLYRLETAEGVRSRTMTLVR